MANKNSWILLALILLTISSYFFSGPAEGAWQSGLILLFTLVKISLLVLYFMELQKAHYAWLLILGLVLVIYVGFILSLHLPGH